MKNVFPLLLVIGLQAHSADVKQLESLERAASNGVAQAQYELSAAYAGGSYKGINRELADLWLYRAATNGHLAAQMRMGHRTIANDQVTALGWFQQAARKGDAEALFQVGRLFDRAETPRTGIWEGREIVKVNVPVRPSNITGRKVAPDIAQAWASYKLAAAKNHAGAMNNMGAMLALAEGGPADYVEAYALFRKAGDQGNRVALANLGYIEKLMTPQQIAQGKRKAN